MFIDYRIDMLFRLFIVFVVFLGMGCEKQEPPEISFDRNTRVEYKIWGGEVGSGSTSLSVFGDGTVVYVQNPPIPNNNTPAINRELNFDKGETAEFFNLLLDAGLLTLKNYGPECCDLPGSEISGQINSYPYKAICHLECDNTWELVRSHFIPLLVRVHPERWKAI